MANFAEYFEVSTGNFFYAAQDGYPSYRYWYRYLGNLVPQDAVSYQPGFILVNTLPELNGSLSAAYKGLDEYNGCDNFIILRFQGPSNFIGLRVNPGQLDQKGIYLSVNNPNEWQGEENAILEGDIKLDLINSLGIPVDAETWPNKTDFPNDGVITVDIVNDNNYTVKWFDSSYNFYASASFNENTYITSAGAIGFFHTTKWNSNITGWDYVVWVDGASAIPLPPSISYFYPDDTVITNGDSTILNWGVTSGTETTSVWISEGLGVLGELIGTSAVSPSANTTYIISAWNSVGSVSASTAVAVTSSAPLILVFSADTPISAGDNTTLTWETSASTSAFIDQGIGWIDTSAVSAGTYEVSALSASTTYGLSAFDDVGNFVTDFVIVTVFGNPSILSNSFSATPNPVCSGVDYTISWLTSGATSAFIDNGVGWIDTSAVSGGSYVTSSALPTTYSLSAWNDVGVMATSTYIQLVYYRSPIANAGSDYNLTATSLSGVSVRFDSSGSYHPGGQSIATSQWTSGSTVVSTSQVYNVTLSAGLHVFDLVVIDGCGQSGTDTVSATITNLIPPVAIASATPLIVNAGDSFNLDGSESYDPDGTIATYLWDLSGTIVSTIVSADTSQSTVGDYTYTLTVSDTSGLSASDTVTVHVNGIYAPSANAGLDQSKCFTSGDDVDILLDGSQSTPPPVGGTIVWFEWDLSAFSLPNVSADIVIDESEIVTIVSTWTDYGTYDVGLTVSASNGIIDRDTVTVVTNRQAIVSAGVDQEHTVTCSGSYYTVTLSGNSDVSGTYVWYFQNGNVSEIGQVVTREYAPGTFSAALEVVTTAANGTVCTSDQDVVNIVINENPMAIVDFSFNPSFINGTSAFVWTTLSWETSGAVSAAIDNGVGVLDTSAVSAGSLAVSGTDDLTYVISAYDASGCMITANAIAIINLGTISACLLKIKYISLFGPESIRWGTCRDINLIDMLPTTLVGTDTETYLQVYQDYLNEMYAGTCGWTLASSALSITACDSSGCLLSAVDNTYQHQTYITTASGTSALNLFTPGDDAKRIFVDNFCQIPRDNISVLEKTYRLTELFDPDLIPIELIQFYAQNLGYEVGLSRDNVGLDFEGTQETTQEAINQKKYLRFMVRNLPTWYKIKSTRNSVKMMLYSFGLVGDFIYYFTKNYLDPTTGIGLNTLDYGGQNVNNYGLSGTSGFNKYVINDNMTYRELQELKCNLAQWEEFKTNKKAYFNMLNDLQAAGNNDWILTEVNPASVKEDISNIPDDFFSSPHFRLWFDILESLTTGNFSTDLNKQKLIAEAIKAIKPINTVFEGVTGVFRTLVDVYYVPYTRMRKHITLISDGYADWYM